jgi:hypothetical protein
MKDARTPAPTFVPALRAQLVAAAEREARQPAPMRLPRPRLRPLVPVLVAAAVLAALVAVALKVSPDDEQRTVAPRTEARPLFGGSLEAGVRYGTRAMQPALSFGLGDDRWLALVADSPDHLLLERRPPRGATPSGERAPESFLAFARPGPVYDPHERGLERSLTDPPADPVAWLRDHPDVDAGQPRPVTVAGHRGEVFDLTFRFSRPAHQAPECTPRGIRCTALGPGDFHRNGWRQRVYVLDTRPGPLLIVLEGTTDAAMREVIAAAEPILGSLEITRP